MTAASVFCNAYTTTGVLGDQPVVVLSHPSGAELVVALRGATVLSWCAPWRTPEGDVVLADLVDGYVTEQELLTQDATRSGLMLPFANRIAGGRYTFDGVQHEVPAVVPGEPETFHGVVRVLDWEVEPDGGRPVAGERAEGSPEGGAPVEVALRTQVRPGDLPGYPFALDVTVRYALGAAGFDVAWTYRNAGERAAPVAGGWHPYFRLPGHADVDGLVLEVPARTAVRTGPDRIPLPGPAARESIGGVGPLALAGVQLDDAFVDLVPDRDGRARTRLTDPASGQGLAVWQTRGGMHVYTGDGLATRPRAAVALEPVESLTDAFNRPECAAAVRLEPGAHRTFETGVELVVG